MFFYDKFAWSSKANLYQAIFGLRPKVLKQLAEKKLLWVFKDAYTNTPALRKFYKSQEFDPKIIHNVKEFSSVPETTKENYINKYSLEDRCRDGRLPSNGIIFKSAGVSSERTYWTQSLKEEERFSVFVPFGLDYLFGYTKKNYHLINCWAFGTWPTAIDFTKAARECGRMINIGPNIEETIETIIKLGPKNNYLISGYPPYLRNLLYEGERKGIKWKEYNIDILTGGEGFVEEWRDLLKKKLGNKSIIISAYGSTDKGLGEGIETPLTITIRNLVRIFQTAQKNINKSEMISRDVFGTAISIPKKPDIDQLLFSLFRKNSEDDFRTPMIFQSDPLTYFQEQKEATEIDRKSFEVVTTNLKTYASQPVIRYNIQDESGIVGYDEMQAAFNKYGINLLTLSNSIPNNDVRPLPYPFFYVFGRSSGMVSLDGANIFPEELGRMIENNGFGEKINSFRIKVSDDYQLLLELELKQKEEFIVDSKILDFLKKELAVYSPGFASISREGLPSSKLQVKVYYFGEGPFYSSPSQNPHIVKYQYVGTKVFGRH